MDSSTVIGLINNAALLLVLGLLYDTLDLAPRGGNSRSRNVLTGIILGAIGMAIMLTPLDFGRGVLFDTRSVLLCVTGFFFGPVPVFLAMAMTGTLRLLTGGTGAWTGVAVIVSSGTIGLAWRYFRPGGAVLSRTAEFFLLGTVVHLVMLALMFTLPREIAVRVLSRISLPVMVIYPLATAVLGKLLVSRENHKKSETALRSSEEKVLHANNLMRYIIEHANSAVAVHDRDIRYIYVSHNYLNQYGLTGKDIIGKHHYEVFPDLPQKWRDIHQKALNGEVSRADRDPYPREDGTVEWTRWECRPWYESDGSVGGFVVYTEVITGRVEAEEALRKSEESLRAIIDASPLAIVSLDPDGRVTTWNTAAENMFGWTAREVIGQFLPIVPDDQRNKFSRLLETVCAGGSVLQQELTRVRKDGSLIEIHLSAAPVRDKDGQVTAIMSLLEDITRRRQAEREKDALQDQLLQAQKMESIGRLAGGVAHDYNNMLSVILGYTELALEKNDPGTPLRADLEEIHAAATRSVDITRQLLAFSRKQTIDPRAFDLNETVGGMLKMLRRLIGEDIDLVWHPGSRLWPVYMDPSQLDQILVNLCVNARDAIRDVGKITIETDMHHFDDAYCAVHPGFTPGSFVMLAVSDDGCGMDRQTRSQLFEPFFTTKEMGKGTGLGLATVYGIVRQNSGFINVYSEPGQGSVFRIYLPKHESAAKPAKRDTPAASDIHGNETVLVVEDEKTILRMARMMLERLGYRVLTANRPTEAVSIARDHSGPIHLIMTDVVMPDMNGRELAARVHGIRPDTKILFMSGYTANVIAHRGVLDEGIDFIQKPFSKQALAAKLREILD